jgi:hypothetical protein
LPARRRRAHLLAMQDPASFNLTEVKKKIDAMIKKNQGE